MREELTANGKRMRGSTITKWKGRYGERAHVGKERIETDLKREGVRV